VYVMIKEVDIIELVYIIYIYIYYIYYNWQNHLSVTSPYDQRYEYTPEYTPEVERGGDNCVTNVKHEPH